MIISATLFINRIEQDCETFIQNIYFLSHVIVVTKMKALRRNK